MLTSTFSITAKEWFSHTIHMSAFHHAAPSLSATCMLLVSVIAFFSCQLVSHNNTFIMDCQDFSFTQNFPLKFFYLKFIIPSSHPRLSHNAICQKLQAQSAYIPYAPFPMPQPQPDSGRMRQSPGMP